MSTLTDTKQELADIISEIIPAFPYIPGRINPESCVINAGSPYLQSGNTYRSFLVTLDVDLIYPSTPNDKVTKELDETTSNIVERLVSNGYGVSEVSQPFLMEVSNATYLAVRIEVTTTVIINEGE
jgi:hypothetical protein